jgi:hypothetical protein
MVIKIIPLALGASVLALGADAGRMHSYYSKTDFALTADADSPQWKGIEGVIAENDSFGKPTPGHRTEVRSRWTDNNLYFLFVCQYEELYLHPNPTQTSETNELWNYDVAEAFIGTDFKDINLYKEFEVSPQGEWVDLDINLHKAPHFFDWTWNSGFKVKARIDAKHKTWYGEMQIPMASIGVAEPAKGAEMRLNLYRIQGPPPHPKAIAWQPTHQQTYHVAEAFGRLVLK